MFKPEGEVNQDRTPISGENKPTEEAGKELLKSPVPKKPEEEE